MRFLKLAFSACLVFSLIFTSGHFAEAAIGLSEASSELTPPFSLGFVTSRYTSSLQNAPRVILIEDLHAHYGVQKNIAGLLEYLTHTLGSSNTLSFALAVEGGTGPIDQTVLATFPDIQLRRAAADYLMRQGELTGAEYFAVMNGLPHAVTGVENKTYYTLHRDQFRKTQSDRAHLVLLLTGLQADLQVVRKKRKMRVSDREEFVRVERDLALLIRVVNLQAVEKEVRSLAPRMNQFVALCSQLLKSNGFESFDEEAVRSLISASIDHYALAMMRNRPLVENTLRLAQSNPGRTAVLVAGGFHTAPMTQLLREAQVNYMVITPAIDRVTEADHDLYVKRLSGDLLTIPEILADADKITIDRGSALARLFSGGHADNTLSVGLGIAGLGYLASLYGGWAHSVHVPADPQHFSEFLSTYANYVRDIHVAPWVTELRHAWWLGGAAFLASAVGGSGPPEDLPQIPLVARAEFAENTDATESVGVALGEPVRARPGAAETRALKGPAWLISGELGVKAWIEDEIIHIQRYERAGDSFKPLDEVPAKFPITKKSGHGPERIGYISRAGIRKNLGEDDYSERPITLWITPTWNDNARAMRISVEADNRYKRSIEIYGFPADQFAVVPSIDLFASTSDKPAPGTGGNAMGRLYEDPDANVLLKEGQVHWSGKPGYAEIKTSRGKPIYDKHQQPVKPLKLDGKPDKAAVVALIQRIRESAAANLSRLSPVDKKYVDEIVMFLQDLNNKGKIHNLARNRHGINGFSDGEVILINRALLESESGWIALFHEAGEGYFASHPEARKMWDGQKFVTINPHGYLRGPGRSTRGAPTAQLGLQDRLFGDKVNARLTSTLQMYRAEPALSPRARAIGDKKRIERFLDRFEPRMNTQFENLLSGKPKIKTEYEVVNALAQLLGYASLAELLREAGDKKIPPETTVQFPEASTLIQSVNEKIKSPHLTDRQANDFANQNAVIQASADAWAEFFDYQSTTDRKRGAIFLSALPKFAAYHPRKDPFKEKDTEFVPPLFERRDLPPSAQTEFVNWGSAPNPNQRVRGGPTSEPVWVVGPDLAIKVWVSNGAILIQRYRIGAGGQLNVLDPEPIVLAKYLMDKGQEVNETLGFGSRYVITPKQILPSSSGATDGIEISVHEAPAGPDQGIVNASPALLNRAAVEVWGTPEGFKGPSAGFFATPAVTVPVAELKEHQQRLKKEREAHLVARDRDLEDSYRALFQGSKIPVAARSKYFDWNEFKKLVGKDPVARVAEAYQRQKEAEYQKAFDQRQFEWDHGQKAIGLYRSEMVKQSVPLAVWREIAFKAKREEWAESGKPLENFIQEVVSAQGQARSLGRDKMERGARQALMDALAEQKAPPKDVEYYLDTRWGDLFFKLDPGENPAATLKEAAREHVAKGLRKPVIKDDKNGGKVSLTAGELLNFRRPITAIRGVITVLWNAGRWLFIKERLLMELAEVQSALTDVLEAENRPLIPVRALPMSFRMLWHFGEAVEGIAYVNPLLPMSLKQEAVIHEMLHVLHPGWNENQVMTTAAHYVAQHRQRVAQLPEVVPQIAAAQRQASARTRLSDILSVVPLILNEFHLPARESTTITDELNRQRAVLASA